MSHSSHLQLMLIHQTGQYSPHTPPLSCKLDTIFTRIWNEPAASQENFLGKRIFAVWRHKLCGIFWRITNCWANSVSSKRVQLSHLFCYKWGNSNGSAKKSQSSQEPKLLSKQRKCTHQEALTLCFVSSVKINIKEAPKERNSVSPLYSSGNKVDCGTLFRISSLCACHVFNRFLLLYCLNIRVKINILLLPMPKRGSALTLQ